MYTSLALKPRGDVTRSPKQVYQWPHKKDLCPPKIFFKKVISFKTFKTIIALDEVQVIVQ